MAEAHLFGMYGMWGPITDFGESHFLDRCRAEISDLQVHGPYRDYDVATIVSEMRALPTDAVLFVQGTSLGSNNSPVVANYLDTRTIHGVFGFQASQWGAHSLLPKNVLFAHLIYSENPINCGLGSYVWQTDKDFKGGYVRSRIDDVHPGDGNQNSQEMFIHEIRRIIAKPTG
jgi:hypothetical protein